MLCTHSPPVPSELLVHEDRNFGLDPDPPVAIDGSSLIVNFDWVSDRPHALSVLPVVLGQASTIGTKLQGRMRGDDVGLAQPG